MSYLTQSYEELQTAVIAALETGASLTFTPKTERITQFYARCLGQSTLWRTKDEGELLALLNIAEGGSSVSDKTYSYPHLMDLLITTLGGGGGGEPANALALGSEALMLNGKYLTLGAASMAIDISSPGADEDDLKAALGALVGVQSAFSYDVTAPVAEIVIPIDASVGGCLFIFSNWANTWDNFGSTIFRVSLDGGSTYLDGGTDYRSAYCGLFGSSDNPVSGRFNDTAGYFNDGTSDDLGGTHPGATFSAVFSPGGVAIRSEMVTTGGGFKNQGSDLEMQNYHTQVQTAGRVTHVKILNGLDETFIRGSVRVLAF